MSLQRVIGAALLTLSFLAGCGGSGSGGGGAGGGSGDGSGSGGGTLGETVTSGSPDTSTALASLSSTGNGSTSEDAGRSGSAALTGDGGTTEEAGTSGSSDASAASTALSSNVTAGTAIGVSLPPGAAQGEVTAEIDQAPVEVVVDGDEAVVVVPDDVPPGTHTLTLDVRGKTITVSFDVAAGLPPTGDARQYIADLIAEALRLLDEYLATHPDDTAAADLRAQLAAAQAQLASLSDEDLQALYQQFAANPLPPSDAPGSCVAAAAGHKLRVNAFLRTARLTSWLAAKHAAHKTDAAHVAVVLAQARMDEALRRLLAYTQAVMDSCGTDAALEQETQAARGRSQRSAHAAAASLR